MNYKGFTIVELLAAILILAILIIIAVPAYNSVSQDTKEASLDNYISSIKSSMLNYANKNLLDEIKPSCDNVNEGCSYCKNYSMDYIISKKIYYVDSDKIVNPVTGDELCGYVKLCFDKDALVLKAEFIEQELSADGKCEGEEA